MKGTENSEIDGHVERIGQGVITDAREPARHLSFEICRRALVGGGNRFCDKSESVSNGSQPLPPCTHCTDDTSWNVLAASWCLNCSTGLFHFSFKKRVSMQDKSWWSWWCEVENYQHHTMASNGAPNKCNNAIQQAIVNGARSCHVAIGSFQYQTGGLGLWVGDMYVPCACMHDLTNPCVLLQPVSAYSSLSFPACKKALVQYTTARPLLGFSSS